MSGEPTVAPAGGTDAPRGPASAAGGTGGRTSAEFWDAYWEGLGLPTRLDPSFAFDRCFARGLDLAFADVTGSVLEIGCAPGKWLAYLAERRGLAPAGIEYSPEGLRATRRNFELLGLTGAELIEADFFALAPEPRFDAVASYGLIEHFDDPAAVLDRHVAWLKPGGRLVIGVPNFRGVHGALQKRLDPKILALHNLDVMRPAFFARWAGERGLAVERLWYFGGFEPGLPIVDRARRGAGVFLARAVLWAGWRLRRSPLLDGVNGPRVSSYLMCVARKPAAP